MERSVLQRNRRQSAPFMLQGAKLVMDVVLKV